MSAAVVTREVQICCRLMRQELSPIDDLAQRFGLPRSEVVRRALTLGVERLIARGSIPPLTSNQGDLSCSKA
jgi:DNA-binding IclR family transcriptional regulator